MKKHYLSVAAIFKNESLNLKEWIEHYLLHGVDHIYLINDNSSDEYEQILKPYIEKHIITLFKSDVGKFNNSSSVVCSKTSFFFF